LIRTTGEHPFYVKGRGWVAALELLQGDLLSSEDGQWVPVEEVYDTGEYETVYNLRIADFHTYFIGGSEWGFSAWAHNTYREYTIETAAEALHEALIPLPIAIRLARLGNQRGVGGDRWVANLIRLRGQLTAEQWETVATFFETVGTGGLPSSRYVNRGGDHGGTRRYRDEVAAIQEEFRAIGQELTFAQARTERWRRIQSTLEMITAPEAVGAGAFGDLRTVDGLAGSRSRVTERIGYLENLLRQTQGTQRMSGLDRTLAIAEVVHEGCVEVWISTNGRQGTPARYMEALQATYGPDVVVRRVRNPTATGPDRHAEMHILNQLRETGAELVILLSELA
jgi:hypothetical protein